MIIPTILIDTLAAFGEVFEFVLPVGVGLDALRRGYTKEMLILSLCAGVQQVVIFSLKFLITAPRPFPYDWKMDSFPSGHTAGAFLAVGFLYAFDYLLRQHFHTSYVSFSCKISVLIGATLVGISRYLSCMHYPIDVIAGAFLGIFFGATSVFLSFVKRESKLIS